MIFIKLFNAKDIKANFFPVYDPEIQTAKYKACAVQEERACCMRVYDRRTEEKISYM